MKSVEEKAVQLYAGEGLAPMVRASTTPLRVLALHYGADFVYTEELIDRSLTESIRVVNGELGTIDYVKDSAKLSKKTLKRLAKNGSTARPPVLLRIDRQVEGGKLICQLGSGEPELALAAALHVHQDVDAIDVNMGCPKKFSVSGGMGSALLSDPDRACRIIRTLTDHLSPVGVPISAKIRLLKDTSSTLDFISGLVQAGAKAVAVHGRRVGDEAVHPADWDSLREVVSLAKSKHPAVPILINGDFYTRQDFVDFQKSTGADGVLLARPALYNTSIFRKPSTAVKNPTDFRYQSPLLLSKTRVVQDYLEQAARYDIHYKNTKYVVCEFMSNRRAPSVRVPYLPQKFPGGQTVAKVCDCQSVEDICNVWGVDYKSAVLQEQNHATTSRQAPAGEHKYLDSYFLGSEGATNKCAEMSETAEQPKKRVRVEETEQQ